MPLQYQFTSPVTSPSFSVSTMPPPPPQPRPQILFAITADAGGCAYYRLNFVSQELMVQHENTVYCVNSRQIMLKDEALLAQSSSIRIQRLVNATELSWFQNVLMPARQKYGFRLIYDIDDILVGEDMPNFNLYRRVFMGTAQYLKNFMSQVDYVTVTTEALKNYYVRRLGIPEGRFKVIPNYIPRYWGDTFVPGAAAMRFRKHQNRPRIGILASATHFALSTQNATDDMSSICQWIIDNRHRYQFVFQGGFSSYLAPYQADFEVYPGVPFLHYPKERAKLDVDLLVCPLQDLEFNRCKSEIKILEAWAAGIPVLAQALPNYLACAPDCCFASPEELDYKVRQLLQSPEHIEETASLNYDRMKDHWLENHLGEWEKLLLK